MGLELVFTGQNCFVNYANTLIAPKYDSNQKG